MASLPEIIPISDLDEDAAAVLSRVRQAEGPVVITQDGRAAAVMLSIDAYERSQVERKMLEMLVRAEKEIAAGVGYSLEEALAKADKVIQEALQSRK